MNPLNNAVSELIKFGPQEVYYHICLKVTHEEIYRTKMLLEKDKYYSKLSQVQLKKELEEMFYKSQGVKINIDDPHTFNEKIQWLKIYDSTPEKTRLADKYLVRAWIKEQIGEQYLVPLIGVWDDFDDIDFSTLPDRFCLKMNHGSGMNYVVKDKNSMNMQEARKLFKAWINRPFYVESLEMHYKDIPKKILVEKYIEEMSGNLYDYKFYCYDGKPKLIQVIGDRNLITHEAKNAFLDLEWRKYDLLYDDVYEQYDVLPKKPEKLGEMISIAEKLSKGFTYVRVDLYNINGNIMFGEMTFTPSSGLGNYGRETNILASFNCRLEDDNKK